MTGSRSLAPLLAALLAQPALLHAQAVPEGPAVPLQQMQSACDPDLVSRTAGQRKDDTYNPGLAGAAAVLEKLRPVFTGFAPNGFETRTGGTVFSANYGMPDNMQPWNFHVLAYPYSCLSNGSFDRDGHYAFSAYITINDGLDHGAYTLPDDYIPDGYETEDTMFGFYRLHEDWLVDGLPEARNGYYHFSSDDRDIYWFTRDGQFPFSYVSREEFLRKQISIKQAAMAHDRKKMEESYTAIGQPFDASQFEDLFRTLYQGPIDRYEALLKQPATWLQQPAIAQLDWNGDDAGYVILDAVPPGEYALVPVKPNPGYLDASKALGEPQYIVIRLDNQSQRGAYFQLRERIEQNVEVFRSLVD